MKLSMRRFWLLAAGVVLVVLAMGLTRAATPVQAAPPLVKLAAGQILKNARGLTLYVFAPDSPGKSTCYNTCAKYWPPVVVPKGMTVPKTMKGIPGTFGESMRKDGSMQLTYDRAPLYTFLEDKDSGDAYGQGVVASGGYWWVVVAAGK